MEHPITATLPGTVTVLVGVGDRVKVDQVVATIETDDTEQDSTEQDTHDHTEDQA